MIRPLPTIGVLLVVGLTGLGVCRADAHQLDEYLQAARIAAGRDHVVVEMSLTPGVAVAPRILQLIDGDRDGRIGKEDIDGYARRVLGDLELSVDGTIVPLVLARVDCPSWEEMREGMGTIRIEARTATGLAAGTHRLHFVNAHEPTMSVYLANALVPSDPGLTIGAQRRDVLQRRVDIEVEVARAYATGYWLLTLAVALGALTFVRLSDHFALSGVHR
jgi:hypothetical protein